MRSRSVSFPDRCAATVGLTPSTSVSTTSNRRWREVSGEGRKATFLPCGGLKVAFLPSPCVAAPTGSIPRGQSGRSAVHLISADSPGMAKAATPMAVQVGS